MTKRNPAASVRARLLNKARADGVDYQLLLTRYGLERFLYRLSVSRERDNFLLKVSVRLKSTTALHLMRHQSGQMKFERRPTTRGSD